MMEKLFIAALFAAFVLVAPNAFAAAEVGKQAPNFEAVDIFGNTVSLQDYKGMPVVLEWTNHDCPFVMKHYKSGNMQKTQKTAVDGGAVWISIVSSAKGKQGNVTPEEARKIVADTGSAATTRILDESGEIGKMYGAQTTPHIFVIDSEGILAYSGAIDSIPGTIQEEIKSAENYALSALKDLSEGTPVRTPLTKAYGCSVKY